MKILANLSVRQRISIAAVVLLVCAGVFALVRQHQEADFKPLFTGLAAEDAAGIVQKLKETGVDFRLPEGGGSVLVPSAKLAEMRLSMAAIGLPKSGRMGFELFDKTNLGATEFTEHVNYRRALEGELERSVMSLAEVEQARVHLTFPKDSVFLDAQQPAKASVLVKVRPGAHLAAPNVQAINHLVASAVEGLSPDAVSVLDMNGNLLGRPKPAEPVDGAGPSEAALAYRHSVEADLLGKVNSTLEPLLGSNKFRAGVSVDCDFTGGEQSEEVFDPAHSVMSSSQRTEDSSGAGSANGVPGTPSTLPRPTSRPGSTSKSVSRMTENITYQTSRTVRKTKLPAGTIKKISLAVLVDQEVTWEREKNAYRRVLVPPTPEKLKVIRDLVAGVSGFVAERGDQLVVDTLPFEQTLTLEPPPIPVVVPPAPPPAAPWEIVKKWDRKMQLMAGGGAAAGLLLLIGLFMWLRRKKKKKKAQAAELMSAAALPAADGSAAPGSELSKLPVEQQLEAKLKERDELQKRMDEQALSSLKIAPVITKTAEVLTKHLRERIVKEPDMTAQILKTWINEDD